jgi:mannose-1-phosphate guanylyltransferase/mannose-6-phosphate isomerase
MAALRHRADGDRKAVVRPWGSYRSLIEGDGFQVKHIVVAPGGTLSLQLHHRRNEHWVVVRGQGRITRGDDVLTLGPNQSTHIPIGMQHRLENTGAMPLELIEVQCGDYLGEDDIVRLADVYGRA